MKPFRSILGIVIPIIFLISCSTPKYSPLYKHWVLIKHEKKDGSKIFIRDKIQRYTSDVIITQHYMYYPSFTFPINLQYISIGDSILKSHIDRYNIKALSDTNLVLLKNDSRDDNDKIEKYVYINLDYYPQYLIANKLIDKENDSTIILNKHFSSFYTGNWYYKLKDKFKSYNSINGVVSFSMLLDSTGKTTEIKQIKNDNIEKDVIDKTIKALTEEQAWDMRYIKGHMNYRLSLSIRFVPKETYQFIDLVMFDDENNKKYQIQPIRSLTFKEQDTLQHYFSKGYKQINSNKFNDAIYSFSRCIIADSLCFEAYYNRAYAYHKMQQIDNSCIDWECLYKQFGQKPAEKLYNENCNRNKH